MTDLAGQVQQTRPELHLLPVHPRYGVATGFYLSTDNLTTEDAVALPCDPDQKGRWHGVVLCRQHRSDAEREDWIAQWRDGGIILPGDIVVVGDPELVRLLAGLAAAQH